MRWGKEMRTNLSIASENGNARKFPLAEAKEWWCME
jgi:hypothetical protein